jgi:hypothetical protein
VPEDVYASVTENPSRVFQFMDQLDVEIPGQASFMLLCMKLTAPKYDIRFYGQQEEYLMDYTKCLLKDRDDYEFHSFKKDENLAEWEMFLPPPVIGLGIRTRLRPGIDPV